MRAWSDMFNAFLEQYDGPGDTSPYTDADYFAHVDGKPRYDGVRDFLASREHPGHPRSPRRASSATARTTPSTRCWSATGRRPYPGSVLLLDHLRTLGIPLAVVSSSVNAPAVLEAAGLADRFQTVVSGAVATELGLPGKPAPDTFLHAADGAGRDRREIGRPRGRGLRRTRRCGRRLRRGRRRRPRRRPGRPDRGRCHGRRLRPRRAGPQEGRMNGRHVGPDPLDRGRFPVHPWALVETSYLPDDMGVTETLFAVANGYLGMRGNPEEGRAGVRARHLPQRLPRDLGDPARRVGVRLRAHRPDHRQRPRHQGPQDLRRRRAADVRHRRPRGVRADPGLPRRRAAPQPGVAHPVRQAGADQLDPHGLDDPAAPGDHDPRGRDARPARRRSSSPRRSSTGRTASTSTARRGPPLGQGSTRARRRRSASGCCCRG